MKGLGGGGGSYSQTSKKYVAPKEVKKKPAGQKLSHSELAARWAENGGNKFVVEEKKVWTKADIEHARAEKERLAAAAKAGPKMTAASEAGSSEELAPVVMAPELARERMASLVAAMEAADVGDSATAADEEGLAPWRRAQVEELYRGRDLNPGFSMRC